ncbi:MAG: tetrahydrofolate dehydrogenase/cyclohydrolase catalytic domain-containing protein [Kiritimatiellae bacterium]|nr:tetrahydrofolate dehydrogenase/cyclohydrolase catalytic domain-containing protein [Kiritimatiellia bacterium]
MAARILDGKAVAAEWRREIAAEAAELERRTGVTPGLGVVLVGDDPASASYVAGKERACSDSGFFALDWRLPADSTQADVIELISRMNGDPRIHGILAQLPLPRQIDEQAVIETILPEKDVDGFTPVNVGRMLLDLPCFLPCTPHGIVRLLMHAGIATSGRSAVVIGRSNIVGKPVAHLLMRKAPGGNATVTVCHTGTSDLARFTREADILVVAAGKPMTVTGDMVKPGAAVIDVGVNRVADASAAKGFRLVGDVDFHSVSQVAGWITPVPGGIGPLTITMLLRNTLEAAKLAAGQHHPTV